MFNGLEWWDETNGPVKPLISFNRIRVPFICDGILKEKGLKCSDKSNALEGFKILDIGCGGGILSEGLGKLGATVVGLDPGEKNILMARNHLTHDLRSRITYECGVIEDYAVSHPQSDFDAVVMSEVIEHVENSTIFMETALKLLKPGGSVFITIPNRTFMSWISFILMGEYILRVLPVGTHEWKKFLTPSEIEDVISKNGMRTVEVKGITYNPVTNFWDWTRITGIQYAMHAVKNEL
ncbi:Ubiquinone biosynthesis O-methyltransferase, mitochondrial [Orchesella cincta]|uniref:Ubiquinone biosynthesis O-methyltransferase, mitochondrial n=1 Tax=Orchesella cincta TaxID=48709 RepID=A0A1D2MMG5_ORCCI|nr:Ubiquinone biosynthesis O-methyltransferase, mitochondrial [Orchesella cincta]